MAPFGGSSEDEHALLLQPTQDTGKKRMYKVALKPSIHEPGCCGYEEKSEYHYDFRRPESKT